MSKQITIGSGGAFEQTEVEQSDDVFWSNNDSNPHWPVPWCYGLRVDPGKTSNSFQAVPGGTLPQKQIYQDALSNQSGVMLIYAEFANQVWQDVLPHKDRGMMQLVRVVEAGQCPNACQANIPQHH
jgi:hypothetical protein